MPQWIFWSLMPSRRTFPRWPPKNQENWLYFIIHRKLKKIQICIIHKKKYKNHQQSSHHVFLKIKWNLFELWPFAVCYKSVKNSFYAVNSLWTGSMKHVYFIYWTKKLSNIVSYLHVKSSQNPTKIVKVMAFCKKLTKFLFFFIFFKLKDSTGRKK